MMVGRAGCGFGKRGRLWHAAPPAVAPAKRYSGAPKGRRRPRGLAGVPAGSGLVPLPLMATKCCKRGSLPLQGYPIVPRWPSQYGTPSRASGRPAVPSSRPLSLPPYSERRGRP